MQFKKIIPCLDIKDGRVVKGVNFVNLKDAGDPVESAALYCSMGADELVFLDIAATNEGRKTRFDLVSRVAEVVTVPFIVGGGISELSDIEHLLGAGASKVSIGTAGFRNPALVEEAAKRFGSERVVCAIDAKSREDGWEVYLKGGTLASGVDAADWAIQARDRGAGEILLTDMDRDGKKNGYNLDLTRTVAEKSGIPVIASGGAGTLSDFYAVLTEGKAEAALAASLFHFNEVDIKELNDYLTEKGVPVRNN